MVHVGRGGGVTLVGTLGTGTPFSTSSWITSGSTVAIYKNLDLTGGLGGILTFEDKTNSDCDGTLYWSNPGTSGTFFGPYLLQTQFQAALWNSTFVGFNGATINFAAGNGDLPAPFVNSVKVFSEPPWYIGLKPTLELAIDAKSDKFVGRFVDVTAHIGHVFSGVILAKSHSGAGRFDDGPLLSGTVGISY